MKIEQIKEKLVNSDFCSNIEITPLNSENDIIYFSIFTNVDIKTKDENISSIDTHWSVDCDLRITRTELGGYTATHKKGADHDFSCLDRQVKKDYERISNLLNHDH